MPRSHSQKGERGGRIICEKHFIMRQTKPGAECMSADESSPQKVLSLMVQEEGGMLSSPQWPASQEEVGEDYL